MSTVPHGRTVATSDEVAAYAARLARAQAIASYPVTPQTIIVERLADLVAGDPGVEFANLESEHSMFGYAVAASRAGVRTFTATSSQGLLYAHEQLHRASRERCPVVAVNVNRAIFAPWSLEADLSDSMSQRDTGWIHLYCASAQEVLDSVICAYRIAEAAMLPVLVNAEGFLLSHTAEIVDVPEQSAVDAFLAAFEAPDDWVIDPGRPRAFSELPEPKDYAAFQRNVAGAHDEARALVARVAHEFSLHFGREKTGALAITGNPDAARAMVTIGTIGETALELLADDADLLLVRVHCYRPFPAAQLESVLRRAEQVTVIDRTSAFGALGPLGADVGSLNIRGTVTDVVCGVGGTDVTPITLRWALEHARRRSSHPVHVPEGVA